MPTTPRPAKIRCFADHRIAMAFSIASIQTAGVVLDDPACDKKTFPTFHATLTSLTQSFAAPSPAVRNLGALEGERGGLA